MAVNGVDDPTYRLQQTRAREAQKDAQRQIEDTKKQVDAARSEADHEINNIRDQFSTQYTSQEEKQAEQLETQRSKAYEELLRQKRQQEAEISRVKRQADQQLHDIHGNTETQITKTEADGKKTLTELERSLASTKEREMRVAKADVELEHGTHLARLNELQQNHDQSFETLQKQRQTELARTKEGYFKANQDALEKYDTSYRKNLETQSESIGRLNTAAAKKLGELRAENGLKLAAYDNRAADPFYRMVDTSARLMDHDQYYQLLAKIPEHEREHVGVTVRGNAVVLSGQRRASDSLEVAPGQTRKTDGFQSYSESFALPWPVEAKSITKYYDGDTLVVTIPKKPIDGREIYQAGKNKVPDKVASARPDFPANLPVTAEQIRAAAPPEKKS